MNMTPERPVLLLDIDGVLNLLPQAVFPEKTEKGALGGGLLPVQPEYLPITRPHSEHLVYLSPEQKFPYLVSIADDTAFLVNQLVEHFDIHWYTMWNESAAAVFAPLAGLPEFPHFECDWSDGEDVLHKSNTPKWLRKLVWTAKTPLIEGHLGTRPFVWVDDGSNDADALYLEEHANVGEFMLLTVEAHTGLTQNVVNAAIEWARSLTMQEEVAS
jgi:hypothetical protein